MSHCSPSARAKINGCTVRLQKVNRPVRFQPGFPLAIGQKMARREFLYLTKDSLWGRDGIEDNDVDNGGSHAWLRPQSGRVQPSWPPLPGSRGTAGHLALLFLDSPCTSHRIPLGQEPRPSVAGGPRLPGRYFPANQSHKCHSLLPAPCDHPRP